MVYRLCCTNPALCCRHIITAFVLFIPSIRVGPVVALCEGISYLLYHTKGHSNTNLCFCCFGVPPPCSLCSLSFFFFLLLSLQFQLRVVILSYHCSMVPGWCSASISFLLIALFIPCLNSSMRGCLLYLLLLAALLNSCMNSSIIYFPALAFIVLLLLLILHLLLQTPFLCLPEILLLFCILTILPSDPPTYFSSRCLLIPLAHMTIPIGFASPLVPLSSLCIHIVCML